MTDSNSSLIDFYHFVCRELDIPIADCVGEAKDRVKAKLSKLTSFVKILAALDATAEVCQDGTTVIHMGKVTRTYLSPEEFIEHFYATQKNIIGITE